MKKLIALLLAAAMLLTMTACGGSAEPVETAPTTTEPVAQVTDAPTEEPTVAPTEDPNAYTAYTLAANESYVDVVWSRGFWEVDMDACVEEAARYGATGGQATPLSLELNQVGFRMEVDYTGYDYITNKVIPYGIVELIGTKAEGPADISGINPEDYQHTGSSRFEDMNGVVSDFGSFANGYLLTDTYWYYNVDTKGVWSDLVYVVANYYVTTGNLYNTVYHVPAGVDDRGEPFLLFHIDSQEPYSPFYPTVQTLTYGDFSFEMSQFAIQCGEERYVYNYRPGMSFSDWACSELNVDGWIPWYGDTVLSPDRAYIVDLGYLDMREFMDYAWTGSPANTLIAEEYDGSVSYFNNSYIGGVSASITPGDSSALEGLPGSATVIDVSGMSDEELAAFLAQFGIDASQVGISAAPSENTTQGVSTSDGTEAGEIAMFGNISVPVAHMVNAETPLFTPGFRIVSKANGRAAYHSVEMTTGLLLDDIIDIYMNGIDDELIPHIKLYAFPESEEFMATLEGHTILNAHPTPLEQGSEMLTIPEDAVCLTFQRVPDGQEAPNSPNPLKPAHENLNENAVYARYVTKDDPNFGEGVNLVFAITFDDELVYWIHMGSNFSETPTGESISGGMRY
ncbi:MAG: PT domain-containing protein [Clostridia bacterium]|nr:PT domain-containing protein [Clostridia bacterium]